MAADRLAQLQERYGLTPVATERLSVLLTELAAAAWAPTTVIDPAQAVDVHVADSLSGLEVPSLRGARQIADLGSGAGFPALVLAVALPEASVTAVESARRKCDFITELARVAGIGNLEVVCARAEDWQDGWNRHDAVCARAVAPLGVLLEYAAPLLREGGALVAWKGRMEPDELQAAVTAADVLGMAAPVTVPVRPFAAAEHRQLVTAVKARSTPDRFPRRTGVALKRPLGV